MSAQPTLSLDALLQVLNAATDKDKVRWNTTAEEDTFRAETDFGMVRLARSPSASRYALSLIDQEGTLLDEFQPSGEGEVIATENLYKKVRNKALNLDRKLR